MTLCRGRRHTGRAMTRRIPPRPVAVRCGAALPLAAAGRAGYKSGGRRRAAGSGGEMAGQRAPHLHLAELSASQFLDVWRHFDADGQWGPG